MDMKHAEVAFGWGRPDPMPLTAKGVSRMLKTAMIQQQCTVDKKENIEKAIGYIKEASSNGAKIICLQELFNTIYFCYELDKKYYDWAEAIPGPTIESISAIAKDENVVIIAPIYEYEIYGELYNTAVIIGPNGEIIGKYRKMSIPFVTEGTWGTGIIK